MSQPIVQVDSFTDRAFAGNPAGVCIMERSRNEQWMRNVAREMNLAETAFVVPRADGAFDLRWFTPVVEVDLCGHATLAAAHVLWETSQLGSDRPAQFHTKSGLLTCVRRGGWIEMDFPGTAPTPAPAPPGMLDALGCKSAAFLGKTRFDYLVEVSDEATLRAMAPDFGKLKNTEARGVIVTARATLAGFDFVSRFFAPGAGVDEDPVTGSAHCALAPYWSAKLGKKQMTAFQASARGGVVRVEVRGDRVMLAGQAVTVIRGELTA